MRRRRILLSMMVACLLLGAPLLVAYANRPDAATEPPIVGDNPESKAAVKAWVEQTGRLITVSGPETAGTEIVINNHKVRLPADAYVDSYFVAIDCIPQTPCPKPPVYVIRRGNAEIVVEERSGRVWGRSGPESAFDFLTGVLREEGQ